jgi:hypothetical protein
VKFTAERILEVNFTAERNLEVKFTAERSLEVNFTRYKPTLLEGRSVRLQHRRPRSQNLAVYLYDFN